ncbi:hypothetical protein [Paractinoplanes hotanensis]|uniref:Uncharacterized protein n=1 Tax=Paractinoplanes hotanensis TaxID=2906497 RepID=A0ABT0XUN3_9ACTN|nr:hypothetical protein [Actinoplanes hotanensis]MCM4077459.1 hypothetical protein [Actinoplanes hotanensis]
MSGQVQLEQAVIHVAVGAGDVGEIHRLISKAGLNSQTDVKNGTITITVPRRHAGSIAARILLMSAGIEGAESAEEILATERANMGL